MSRHDLKRREFLEILMSLPLGAAIACAAESGRPLSDVPLSAQQAMQKLVRVLGPWSESDRDHADAFAPRFVAAGHIVGSEQERELLLQLARDLYSLVEVRFFVSGIPPWGECLGDRTWHTRAPA